MVLSPLVLQQVPLDLEDSLVSAIVTSVTPAQTEDNSSEVVGGSQVTEGKEEEVLGVPVLES